MARSTLWKIRLSNDILEAFDRIYFAFVIYILQLMNLSRLIYDLISTLEMHKTMAFALIWVVSRHRISGLLFRFWRLVKCIFEVRQEVIHHRIHRRRVSWYELVSFFFIRFLSSIVVHVILKYFPRLVFRWVSLFTYQSLSPWRAAIGG